MENHQRFSPSFQCMYLRIRFRNMRAKRSFFACIRQGERHKISHKSASSSRDQRRQRVSADQRMQNLKPLFSKCSWLIHTR